MVPTCWVFINVIFLISFSFIPLALPYNTNHFTNNNTRLLYPLKTGCEIFTNSAYLWHNRITIFNTILPLWSMIKSLNLDPKNRKLGPFVNIVFKPFEVFYNYKAKRADKWCWQGCKPSGRQKGIVLTAVKMINIKQCSTDDCNLAKALQGYLTRRIKQGNSFFGRQKNNNIRLAAVLGQNCLLHFSNRQKFNN